MSDLSERVGKIVRINDDNFTDFICGDCSGDRPLSSWSDWSYHASRGHYIHMVSGEDKALNDRVLAAPGRPRHGESIGDTVDFLRIENAITLMERPEWNADHDEAFNEHDGTGPLVLDYEPVQKTWTVSLMHYFDYEGGSLREFATGATAAEAICRAYLRIVEEA